MADRAHDRECRPELAARPVLGGPGGRRDSDSPVPLQLEEPEDHQAPPRQAPRRHGDGGGADHPTRLTGPRYPVVLAVNLVFDGAAVAVGARPIDEALLDEPAGQGVELRHATRPRDGAAADAAVWLDCKG